MADSRAIGNGSTDVENQQDRLVILIAEASEMRDGLRALLAAMPHVKSYEFDIENALPGSLVDELVDQYPSLVLVDCDISAETYQAAINLIKSHWPDISVLWLVDDVQLCQTVVKQMSVSEDAILQKGLPASRLYDAIMENLPLK